MENFSKMTARQLKAYIRKATKEVNEKYAEYVKTVKHEQGSYNEVLEREHERLYQLGKAHPDKYEGGKDVSEKKIGVGLSWKHKEELIVQARALEQFNNVDSWTPEADRTYNNAEKQAYNTFIANNNYNLSSDNFTIDDYHNLVETLGALSEKINNFGYADVMSMYVKSDRRQRVNMVSAAVSTMKQLKGGYTQRDAMDLLRVKLK